MFVIWNKWLFPLLPIFQWIFTEKVTFVCDCFVMSVNKTHNLTHFSSILWFNAFDKSFFIGIYEWFIIYAKHMINNIWNNNVLETSIILFKNKIKWQTTLTQIYRFIGNQFSYRFKSQLIQWKSLLSESIGNIIEIYFSLIFIKLWIRDGYSSLD